MQHNESATTIAHQLVMLHEQIGDLADMLGIAKGKTEEAEHCPGNLAQTINYVNISLGYACADLNRAIITMKEIVESVGSATTLGSSARGGSAYIEDLEKEL